MLKKASTPEVTTFTFKPTKEITISFRALLLEGVVWFVATDVYKALELHACSLRRQEDTQKLKLPRTQLGMRQGQATTLISEGVLYSLCPSSSHQMSAKPWVKTYWSRSQPTRSG